MLKRIVTIAVTAGVAVAFLTSCGSSSSTTTTPKGSLTSLVGDIPGLCDAVSFPFNVTDLSLVGYSPLNVGPGGTPVNASSGTTPINGGGTNAPEIKINLGCLRDFSTVLNISPANVGTYQYAYFTLSDPTLLFYDPTLLPPSLPINIAQLTLNPLKNIQVPISPPLVIIGNEASVIQIDFDVLDMIQSITTDTTNGKLDIAAIPEITVTPVTASGSQGQGFGELDDLVGFVRSVTLVPPGNTSLYDGSFTLQLLSASASGPPLVTVNLSNSSQLYGFTALNQLVTDSFLEVDAYIDVQGNFVATSVEDEYVESVPALGSNALPKLALIGPVTSITKDASGNVASFNLWMRDIEPNDTLVATPDLLCTVNVTSSTTYQYSSRSANFANLPFGPGNITVGQELVVHGAITVPQGTSGSGAPSLPDIVAADKVYDKLQSIQGSFSSLVQVADDDKTGAFVFAPCSKFFNGQSAMVLTSNQTAFVNLIGLSALSGRNSPPNLLIKGLPFYEAQAQTINGVPVPAGTLVILAKQVHQL